MNAPRKYILLVWAGDSLCNRVPVLARRDHCVFFGTASVPLMALHDEWVTPFSTSTRSTSSPVRGSDLVLPWQIFNGSWNRGYPGNDSVRWCLITRTGLSDLSVSVLFWLSAVKDNDKRQVKHMAPSPPGAVMMYEVWTMAIDGSDLMIIFMLFLLRMDDV